MTKAYAKDWRTLFLKRASNMFDGLLSHCWISRAIGQKETIVCLTSKSWKVVVPWHDFDLDSSTDKTSQLIELEANINTKNTNNSTGGMLQRHG